MKNLLGMTPSEMSEVFKQWNQGPLNSYLVEITAEVLAQKDPASDAALVDVILDAAGQKGTGKWTSISALDMGVPAATIAEAVFARCISAVKEERLAASSQIEGPAGPSGLDREEWISAIHDALYCSKICSYAQGFQLMKAAESEYNWTLNYGEIAQIWRGGCIIRASFLQKIKEAYDNKPGPRESASRPIFSKLKSHLPRATGER
jgi:6-phosphogluconate dehydrogenase